METINIGKIVKPHGVRGEMKVYSSSDFIMERLKKNAVVFLEKNGMKTQMKVSSSRMHKEMALVKFVGVDSMNDAELWRDADVLIDRTRIPSLKEGYYFFELKGLDVYSEENEKIGVVSEVEEGLANNNLRIVKLDGSSVLVPYVSAFVKEVDLSEHRIVIRVIEGLL